MNHKILEYDNNLLPFEKDFDLRAENLANKKKSLLKKGQTLMDFANGHEYFGFHKTTDGWYYREWAPAADGMYLTGEFCNWDRHAHPMEKKENGIFELFLPGADTLRTGMSVLAIVVKDGQEMERIPAYATRVVQDPTTITWTAQIHEMESFPWTDKGFVPKKSLYIYECHIGMAQEEGKVGTYREFTQNVLPRIHDLGYNTFLS